MIHSTTGAPVKPPKRLIFRTKNGTAEPVTVPPLVADLSAADLQEIRSTPYECLIPCHTQSVEHTVALVTKSTKQYRTEKTQLAAMLQTAEARKTFSGRVTHKRFKGQLADD